jgi:FKBP-type peptidyl-prolyl cis-trans isomerase
VGPRRTIVSGALLAAAAACSATPPAEPPPPTRTVAAPPPVAPEPELTVTEHGVGITELRPGAGRGAVAGDTLEVHYVGRLEDGTEFESSRKRGTPYRFELGAEIVIPGWDEGLVGIRVGEIRRLIVPPSMGYGPRGSGEVPPDAMLEFDIELLSLERR